MHFGEYELFPSLIGLSPLPTVHPKTFQRLLVRPSSQFYLTFSLTMGRSQGFASSAIDLFALFRLAFASAAPLKGLTLPMTTNSQAHYAKGTPSHLMVLRPLVGARFQVLFHSPVRGAFHLSLTVLVHYRSLSSIQPYRMVPADSDRISRVPPYSGYHYLLSYYVYGAITRYGPTFQTVLLLINSVVVVLQPQVCLNNLGLGCSHFDRHYSGNHYCFLFLRLMRCFSSPGLPPAQQDIYCQMGCPIRKSTDRQVFAPPRRLSQLITSFFASESLGILRTPLLIFFRSFYYTSV